MKRESHLMLCLVSAAALLWCCGCRVIDSGKNKAVPPDPESAETRFEASRKLGEGILTAFRDRDFETLKKNTPGELSESVGEKDFATSCRNFQEKFGALRDFRFLTALETPAFDNLIWIATFVRSGTDSQEIRRQLLFRVVTMPVDGKPQVVSYGFI